MVTLDTVKHFVQGVGQTVVRESPSILTGVGVVGLVTTTALAIRATPKALILIEEEKARRTKENSHCPDLSKVDVVKTVWKCYIPTVAVGTITAICVVGANSINLKRNAALFGVYTFTENAFKEYQNKVIETIGKGKEEKIHEAIAQDHLDRNPLEGKEVIITTGEQMFYDDFSGRYFKGDIENIRRAQNNFNAEILGGDPYKPLNDFYDMIGLKDIGSGYYMGWDDSNNLLDIRYSTKIADDQKTPCIVMTFKNPPHPIAGLGQ